MTGINPRILGELGILENWPKPWNVHEYYYTSLKLLKFTTDYISSDQDNPFIGMTSDELGQTAKKMRDELDDHVLLLLTASFEAILRVDLAFRGHRRRKLRDSYSQSLRNTFHGRMTKGIRFDEILDAWRKELLGAPKDIIGNFKQVVRYRHWLAHGRYWKQTSGLTELAVKEVWERGNDLLQIIPILPEIEYAPPPEDHEGGLGELAGSS
jgi:hypothetical protein